MGQEQLATHPLRVDLRFLLKNLNDSGKCLLDFLYLKSNS